MKKNKWLIAGVLILSMCLMAGCGAGNEAGQDTEKATLMVYNWGGVHGPGHLDPI